MISLHANIHTYIHTYINYIYILYLLIHLFTTSYCNVSTIQYKSTEQQKLGSIIEAMIPGFIADWKPSGDLLSQEVLYIQSLVLFLREGLEVAENAISIVPKSTDNDIEEYKWVVDDTLKDTGYPKLRLFDVYLNAFQRVVGLCLNEMAARPATNSPQNQEFLSDFVAWEQSLRRNLTGVKIHYLIIYFTLYI